MPRPKRTPKQRHLDGLPAIHPNAAGIDIGADEIVVAVPPDRAPHPVRAFRTFTPDLQALVAWLVAGRIDTVALESTGMYGVPSMNCSNSTASSPIASMPGTSKRFPAGKVIGCLHRTNCDL